MDLADIAASVRLADTLECPPARWGILGPGAIARQFVADAREATACEVTAVGSRDPERAERFATTHGIEYAYGSYADLVASDVIDAVYIATPHSEHAAHAILALEAGKPVLVEKAFTRNAAEARTVFEVARRHGLFAMEAMWSRFLPHSLVARALVDAGAIGKVVQVVADHGQALTHVPRLVDPGLAGGALLDLGVYPVSFIHSILGRPRGVRAEGHLLASGVDASAASALLYPDALAVATCTLLGRTGSRAWIAGTEGWIDFDRDFYREGGITVTVTGREALRWELLHPAGGFQYQIAEAARCIDAGMMESTIMPWAATVEVLEVVDEIRRQVGVRYPGEPELEPMAPEAPPAG